MIDRKPYRHRFPLNVIDYALRLYHRFHLSQRDVQELLRGVQFRQITLALKRHARPFEIER